MNTNSIGLLAAIIGLASLNMGEASAAQITEVFKGTVSYQYGTDTLFGGNVSTGTTFTATYVFDTSLGTQSNSTGYFALMGGALYGPASPATSVTLSITGVPYLQLNSGSVGQLIESNADVGNGGFGSGWKFTTAASALNAAQDTGLYMSVYIPTNSPNAAPFPTSLTSPFSYVADPAYDYIFGQLLEPGGTPNNPNLLDFNVASVTVSVQDNVGAVPEPSTWAMMLLGFLGLGCMACRRKHSLSALVAT